MIKHTDLSGESRRDVSSERTDRTVSTPDILRVVLTSERRRPQPLERHPDSPTDLGVRQLVVPLRKQLLVGWGPFPPFGQPDCKVTDSVSVPETKEDHESGRTPKQVSETGPDLTTDKIECRSRWVG